MARRLRAAWLRAGRPTRSRTRSDQPLSRPDRPGPGRDLLGVLDRRSDASRVTALLVEYDPELAAHAQEAAKNLPSRVNVRLADAAQSNIYADAVPADLVLLCGIFGNISDANIQTTIEAAPQL